ncbi:tetratricopeptide repeat protein, partial [Scytonema sp. NUACC26]|uniref:tetratricopeptide repeat protein n=1 Tax=Scytonema sp. NUACC26 TaxID=3140176 RepID=UPI0038B23983
MFQQNFLSESDIDTLINLLLRSQQSRTREALCFSIGIDPKRISFLRDSSDSDFFLLLIKYLNEIGDREALCKLCCKELVPIFQKGTYSIFLSELAVQLNCSQEFKPNSSNDKQPTSSASNPTPTAPSVSVNPFNQLAKNKLVTGSIILIMGLAGFSLYNRNINASNAPHLTEQPVSQTSNLNREDSVTELKAGLVYYEQRNYDRAIARYNRAIRLNPNYVEAYYKRGNAYSNLKDYDRAIADYNQALKLYPNYT